jgi:ribonuclease HI
MTVEIYTDGASRGNPGPGAIAFIIARDGKIVMKHKHFIGKTTNNVAEYRALIAAMERAGKLSKEIRCYSDSKLMIHQLKGEYKVKKPHIRELFQRAKDLERKFEKVEYVHVNRTNHGIRMVDRMVNEVLNKVA